MSAQREQIRDICMQSSGGFMFEVLRTILDRGEVTEQQMLDFLGDDENDPQALYEGYIVDGINRLDDHIQEVSLADWPEALPYIIITTNPTLRAAFEAAGGRGVELAEQVDAAESDRAVATLQEARTAVRASAQAADEATKHATWLTEAWRDALRAANNLPKSGGTIGPLTDGTVIKVRPVTVGGLAGMAEILPADYPASAYPTEVARIAAIIDAYNAAKERVVGNTNGSCGLK